MRKSLLGAAIPLALATLPGCSSDIGTEPGNPVAIVWASCINDTDAPSWFAVQDGSKAWTRVTQTNGVYSFTVRADKIGVATFSNGALVITYATPAEIDALAPDCNSALRTVTGTVTGYASLDDIFIQAELGGTFVSGAQTPPAAFSLADVTPSTFDVLAVRSRQGLNGSTFQRIPSSVFIRRSLSTSPLALIDMNSATEAGAPVLQTATIVNAATGETLDMTTSLNTPTTGIDMSRYSAALGTVGGNVTAPFYGLPATRLVAGESQTLDVTTAKSVSSNTTDARFAAVNYVGVADKTATMGPALGAVTVTGGARPGATYAIQAGYDQVFEFDVEQGTGISARAIQVTMTKAYAGSSATQVVMQVPDLSKLSGFLSGWQITPGSSATWTFYAVGATLDLFKVNNQNYVGASRQTTFTP
jgi:hypothetical protein